MLSKIIMLNSLLSKNIINKTGYKSLGHQWRHIKGRLSISLCFLDM